MDIFLLNPSDPTSSMVEYPKHNHQSTTASMRQEHQCGERANLLEHSGNDHKNNANNILALFQCIVHCLPLYFQCLHQHGAIVHKSLLKIHQKFVIVSVLTDFHWQGHTLQLLS